MMQAHQLEPTRTDAQTVALRGLDLSTVRRVTFDGTELVLAPEQHEVSAADVPLTADRGEGVLRLTLMLDCDRRFDIR